MSAPALVLLAERGDDGSFALRSPRVGVWSGHPAPGALVSSGSPAGRLKQLGASVELYVPDGVAGQVEIASGLDLAVAVGFGEALFRVRPLQDKPAGEKRNPAAPLSAGAGLTVKAPTDGVFYRSPSPGAPPYVVAGNRVAAGQAVGLIEVMKTFSPIVYGGPALPESAEVVEVLAKDGQEVRAGQPLIAVR